MDATPCVYQRRPRLADNIIKVEVGITENRRTSICGAIGHFQKVSATNND